VIAGPDRTVAWTACSFDDAGLPILTDEDVRNAYRIAAVPEMEAALREILWGNRQEGLALARDVLATISDGGTDDIPVG
jgi:hypothetical protein